MEREKAYLGDGVYAAVDHTGRITLTAEDGIAETDRIYLEQETIVALLEYVEAVTAWLDRFPSTKLPD